MSPANVLDELREHEPVTWLLALGDWRITERDLECSFGTPIREFARQLIGRGR